MNLASRLEPAPPKLAHQAPLPTTPRKKAAA